MSTGPTVCSARRVPSRAVLVALAGVFAVCVGNVPTATGLSREARAAETTPTPIFSARRLPVLVQSMAARPKLVEGLQGVVAASPAGTCLEVTVQGRSLFNHNTAEALIPASNQKVVTAKLALDVLGAGYRYRTDVAASMRDSGIVDGDLYLVGGGDPVLRTDAYAAYFGPAAGDGTSIEKLADAVVAKGLRQVTGSVIGDESRYDEERSVPGWPGRYLEQHQLGPLSALAVDQGFTDFPEEYSEEGLVDLVAADDPAMAAAQTFTELLRERGVKVDGPASSGVRPARVGTIATITSPPLTQIVAQLLNRSDNQISELLVKEAGKVEGRGGTTAAGLDVFHDAFDRLRLPGEGVHMVDGSGLSYDNRLTCGLLETLLERAGPESQIADGLAIGGETGTLRERFTSPATKGRIRAKTGTLNDVTSLSGFASPPTSPALVFSYIANGAPVSPELLEVQENLGRALVDYSSGVEISQLGPR